MKKIIFCLALLCGKWTCAYAAGVPLDLPPLDDLYFGTGAGVVLTPQEREGLKISQKWQNGGNLKPVQGPDGSVRFIYGAAQPSIVCAVMQVTDIELEAGEVINSLHIGDNARWLLEPALTGSGSGEVQHIIVKPTDVGLETSLVATTNKRTYHIRLKSDRRQYMPKVSFIYPGAVLAKWQEKNARQENARKEKTLESGEYMDNLDFNYRIEGNAPWKPLRVYNDGQKTIIQMGKSMREAPSLLLVRGGETVMANYRLQGDRYIVDDVFEQAILIAGVGSRQTKVTITKGK